MTDRKMGSEGSRRTLRRQLFIPFMLGLGLSISFLGSACFLLFSFDTIKNRRINLADSAAAIAGLTGAYVDEHRHLVRELAVTVEEIRKTDPGRTEQRLQEFHRRAPAILTLIVTDAAGNVIASERQLALGGGSLQAEKLPNVADREYFRRPRATGRPYLSDVFIGRGFGQDPIVAVAAPWQARDGAFGGIVEGSLDLARLGQVGASFQSLPAVEIFIVDGRSQLLWSGPAGSYGALAPMVIGDDGAHLVGKASVPGTDWTVAVRQPVREIYRSAVPQAAITLGLMLAAFVFTVLLTSYLARRVARPLEELSARLDHIELGAAAPALAPVPPGAPREVAVIVGSTHRLLERLGATYADLSRVLAEQEATIAEEIRQRTYAERERDQLFELGLDMLCVASFDGYFQQLNPAWERALGWTPEELMARPYVDFVHPDDLEGTFREAQKLALGGTTIDFENRYRTRHGAYLWLSWRAAAVHEQKLIYAAARDISERKKIEQIKDDFISIVSHELRTPLTSIRGSLGLIVGGVAGELPEKVRALAEVAARNSERLVRLVDDILDVEKIESGTMALLPARVDLMALVEQAVDSNRAYASLYNVGLRIVSAVPGAHAWADADRIQQVLANLLSNAAKHAPRGSTVEIGVLRRDEELRISVTDHGKGIPLEFQPHVFEKFAQADTSSTRHKGGTGLGLAISKAIVERHSGRLWFETAQGAGTTFTFAVPGLEDSPRNW
jgi:PAS domain S-box-containing protein